ncbi:MAG: rhomboid family intramembrane serine protease, partial [bacterium]|nr:rhomboid family intramembrane serine protease [bacterium]
MGIYDREYYGGDEFRPLRPLNNKSMVTLLIIANIIVFAADFLFTNTSHAIVEAFGLTPQTPLNFKWWQFITYGFTHDPARISHILFNMATLFFLGRSVEDRLGRWEFFRFYMLAIAICGIVWCVIHRGDNAMLIGASGATTAVSMLFVFLFPQATLMLYFAIPVKAWVVGVIIIVANMLQPMGSGVAYDVHLVGAGFAALYFFGKLNFGFLGSYLGNLKSNLSPGRKRLKIHRPSDQSNERSQKDEQESDRILDKI